MDVTPASLSNAAVDAPVLVLRQALNASAAEAQALLKVLPPPPSLRGGRLVDVYA
jgi:hypothetical protein